MDPGSIGHSIEPEGRREARTKEHTASFVEQSLMHAFSLTVLLRGLVRRQFLLDAMRGIESR